MAILNLSSGQDSGLDQNEGKVLVIQIHKYLISNKIFCCVQIIIMIMIMIIMKIKIMMIIMIIIILIMIKVRITIIIMIKIILIITIIIILIIIIRSIMIIIKTKIHLAKCGGGWVILYTFYPYSIPCCFTFPPTLFTNS